MTRRLQHRIHESVELRREDLRGIAGKVAEKILGREECDQVSAGTGPLGSFTNPIPVNGPRAR